MNGERDGIGAALAAYRAAAAREPLLAVHADDAFERRAVLGEGGMGLVERVWDRRLGREAALKRIRGELLDDEARERFRREARISARLQHPAIPAIYECGVTPGGDPYLLMRVIEGQELKERSRAWHAEERGPAEVSRPLLEALARVAEAIAYAHSEGVIHRDLKPSNVMLGPAGEVLVMDWGLAKAAGEADPRRRAPSPEAGSPGAGEELTQYGTVLGTPGYMAPEQAAGEGEVGAPADVFALGAILVELLTGAPPIEGATLLNKLNATLSGQAVRPRQRRPELPAELDSLADAALQTAPEDRPGAAAFGADLRAWLEGRELGAHRYSRLERLRRWSRAHSLLLTGLSALTLLSALAAGLLTWETVSAARAEAALARASLQEEQASREASAAAARRRAAEESARAALAVVDAFREVEARASAGGAKPADAERLEALLGEQGHDPALATWAARILSLPRSEVPPERVEAILERSIALHPLELEPYWELHRREVPADALEPRSPALERYLAAQRAAGGEPADEVARAAQARAALRAGRFPAALEASEQGLELAPSYPLLHVLRGEALLKLAREEEAAEALGRAIELDPGFAAAYCVRGRLRHHLGDDSRAVDDLTEAVQLTRQDWRALLLRGEALVSAGHGYWGLRDAARVLQIESLSSEFRLRAELVRARGAFLANDLRRAAELLQAELSRSSDARASAWLARVRARQALEGAAQARRTNAPAEEAASLAGQAARLLRGLLEAKQGELGRELEAVGVLTQVELLGCQALLDGIDSAQGQAHMADAERLLLRLIAKAPHRVEPWLTRARLCFLRGRREEALDTQREAARRFPWDPRPRERAGFLLFLLGRRAEGLAAWREALARNPTLVSVRLLLVEELLREGRREEALDQLRQLVFYAPDLWQGHVRLGRLLATLGEREAARRAYERALALEPPAPVRARVEQALRGLR